MSRSRTPIRSTRHQRGQSMVEYVVIAAALAAALFTSGAGSALCQAIKTFYANLTLFISLP
jgi:Flp pilus assembly pilin Flp